MYQIQMFQKFPVIFINYQKLNICNYYNIYILFHSIQDILFFYI